MKIRKKQHKYINGLWRSMEIYEDLWRSMKIYEDLWRSMKIYGDLWRSMKIYMKIYEDLWRHIKKCLWLKWQMWTPEALPRIWPMVQVVEKHCQGSPGGRCQRPVGFPGMMYFFSWFSRYVLKDNIGYDIYMIYNMYMIYYIYVSDQVNMKFIF